MVDISPGISTLSISNTSITHDERIVARDGSPSVARLLFLATVSRLVEDLMELSLRHIIDLHRRIDDGGEREREREREGGH